MKFKIYLAALVLTFFSSGCSWHSNRVNQGAIDYCSVGMSTIVARYKPQNSPKFFFKSAGKAGLESSWIAYVGFDEKQKKDQNYIFQLNPKSALEKAVPGDLDPIGLFQEDIISVPQSDGVKSSMAFYLFSDFLRSGIAAKPILVDQTIGGRYQSLGVIQKSPLQFRIITDGHEGGEFRDYEYSQNKLKPLGPARVLCSNLRSKKSRYSFKLPMLSKDGHYFSAFHLQDEKMNIYRIDEKTGSCTWHDSPSLGPNDIGKLDFSPDSSKVAFHFSDRMLAASFLTFGVPNGDWQLRSAIYDLKSKNFFLLPIFGPGTNTFYPTFLPNGNVLVLVQSKAPNASQFNYEFVEVNYSRSRPIKKETLLQSLQQTKDSFRAFGILSDRWLEHCFRSTSLSMRYHRMLILMSLQKNQCEQLINETAGSLTPAETEIVKNFCKTL